MITLFLSAALVATPPAAAPASPAAGVSAQRLMDTVRALPTRRSPGPTDDHRDGLLKTQSWLAEQVRGLGYEPTLEKIAFSLRDGPKQPEWNNIVFELRGRERPKRVLIVGAHFDAVADSPGADDNATGVAAVLEIARVLKDAPLRETVRFVLFNLEEQAGVSALHGSTQHAERVQEQINAGTLIVTGMLSFDMLGFYSDQPGSQRNPFPDLRLPGFDPPTVADFIALGTTLQHRPFVRGLAAAMRETEPAAKTFVFDHAPVAPPMLLRSDHGPFLARGIPAVLVTDTAEFRNPNYHLPSDTADTIDVPRFTATVRALAGAIRQLAGPVGEPETWPPPSRPGDLDTPPLLPPTKPAPPDGRPKIPPKSPFVPTEPSKPKPGGG